MERWEAPLLHASPSGQIVRRAEDRFVEQKEGGGVDIWA